MQVSAIVPFTKKPTFLENPIDSYLIVAAPDQTQHLIRTFTTVEQLQDYDRKFRELGYRLKNCDLYPNGKREGGIALWHFDTDFELQIK